MSRNFLELNGRRYDALSGKLLSDAKHTEPGVHAVQSKSASRTGQAIDGVIAGSYSKHTSLRKSHPTPTTSKSQRPSTTPRQPSSVRAHKPEHAKTLMRHVVRKPKPADLKHPKAQAQLPASPTIQTTSFLPKTPSQINQGRLERAHHVRPHHMIRRFHTPKPPIVAKLQPVPLKVAPAPAAPSPKPQSANIFEQGLAQASSHQTPHQNQSRKTSALRKPRFSNRFVGFATALGAIVALVGFVVYLNLAPISVAVASSRAGFTATAPNYKPAGFTFSTKIQVAPGQVTLNFHSRTDDRHFSIVQQTSQWNNQKLQEFLTNTGRPFTALDTSGRKIYVYRDNTATWVNDGILYQLHGNADLSTSQVTHIASSM